MPQGVRMERVGEEFREVLAEAILKLKDPRVGFVTVTGVRVTPDLRLARVFYTALGDDRERAATRAGLRSASPHLRGAIGKQVRLKFLPELEFEEDVSIERSARIEELLRRMNAGEADDG
jgi:ribosome-binding factor A